MDRTKAYEVLNGLLINPDLQTEGSFISSGPSSPVGSLALEAGDFYIQNTGTKPILWQCTGPTTSDWRQLSAQDIPFSDTIQTFGPAVQDVKAALNHVRETTLTKPNSLTTTLNGTKFLTGADFTLQIASGSAIGFTFQLPDATSLFKGRSYNIVNDSDEPIDIDDNSGAKLFTLNSGEAAILTLELNSTAAGKWIQNVTSTSATGISSFVLETSTLFSTTSSTDILVTDFSVTPDPGRYAIWFSGEFTISQNNRLAEYVLYVDGIAESGSRRKIQGIGSNYQVGGDTLAEISVNGSQAVDVRINIDAGSVELSGRSLVLIRLGAA